ncbi:MAG: pilin, partial [Patescibacteria group bacterium]
MPEKTKMFLLITGFANKALAQTTGGSPSFSIDNPLGTTSIVQIINNVLNYLIYISVPILALMILIGGFQILTARGDPGQITSGRKTITYAVIGFLIILLSKGVALIL